MQALIATLQIVLFFALPYYLSKANKASGVQKIFSDVVVCFLMGILLGNTKQFWLPDLTFDGTSAAEFTHNIAHVLAIFPVLVAIPMLLIITDVTKWIKYTGPIMFSFVLCVLAVVGSILGTAYWYGDSLENIDKASGMITGVYIGGTPNMAALQFSLDAPQELFGIMNSTDLICSGIYFLFITSVAKPFYSLFLRPFVSKNKEAEDLEETAQYEAPFPPKPLNWNAIKPMIIATLVALLIVGLSVGIASIWPDEKGEPNGMIVMIALTSISIAVSFIKPIRSLKNVYQYGQYLLLIFAIAAGYMSDFAKLLTDGTDYLAFNAICVAALILTHFFFAWLFRIDVDTFIITGCACIFGPPFIGQISEVIKNREILAAGMSVSLIGLALGNYLGMLVGSIVGGF